MVSKRPGRLNQHRAICHSFKHFFGCCFQGN